MDGASVDYAIGARPPSQGDFQNGMAVGLPLGLGLDALVIGAAAGGAVVVAAATDAIAAESVGASALQEMSRIATAIQAMNAGLEAAEELEEEAPEAIQQGQHTLGSLAGKCGELANSTLANFPGSVPVTTLPHQQYHVAVKLANGMISDPSLRDNLASLGQFVGDIPQDQILFAQDEWDSLIARFPNSGF